jgi:uncharacterized SAM-binding protein YcdF (DUF218 family)
MDVHNQIRATKRWVRVWLALGIAVLVALAVLAYGNLGLWLVVSDPLPQSLDAFFTFAGDNDRIPYSRQLYARYPNALWIISDPTKKVVDSLSTQGFDTSRIVVVDTCKNTFSEVDCIAKRGISMLGKARMPGHRLSIGLASSPYHMRRIKVLVAAKHPQAPVTFVYLPAPFDLGGLSKKDYQTWWKSKVLAPIVRQEVNRIVYSIWRGFWE